jgi:hypothetical protein
MNTKLVECELVENDSHFYKKEKKRKEKNKTTSIEETNVQLRCNNNQDCFNW